MTAPDRKLKVGVTLHVRKGVQSMWENGIFQNCVFLAQLLSLSPVVEQAYIVCSGDGGEEDWQRFVGDVGFPLLGLAEAQSMLDVVVEMSAGLGQDWVLPFRARGGKVVSCYVGNDFFLDAERLTFQLPNAWLIPDAPRDRVWTLAEYEKTCLPYYQAAVRAPTRVMPHLWSPQILEKAIGQTAGALMYRPGRARWRVGIMEPNLSFVKTFHIPLLSCEAAHRADPQVLDAVTVFSTRTHAQKPLFAAFVESLDVVRQGLATFEDRHPMYEILSHHVDALLCHHWENGQNYLYYEALYCGFPLIHNSPFLDGCGYRYADFDCEDGGRQLRHAHAVHDMQLDDYRRAARQYLTRLDPALEANVRVYTEEIRALFG